MIILRRLTIRQRLKQQGGLEKLHLGQLIRELNKLLQLLELLQLLRLWFLLQ